MRIWDFKKIEDRKRGQTWKVEIKKKKVFIKRPLLRKTPLHSENQLLSLHNSLIDVKSILFPRFHFFQHHTHKPYLNSF